VLDIGGFLIRRNNIMESVEARIIRLILEDLNDRRGFRQAFDDCDEDIQIEIRDAWRTIVKNELD
jgi:hypothetical protein